MLAAVADDPLRSGVAEPVGADVQIRPIHDPAHTSPEGFPEELPQGADQEASG